MISVSVYTNGRKHLKKKPTELPLSFRSAQSEFEATFRFTDTVKVKLFTAENESSSKTAVSLDNPLVIITSVGHHHLEYFIQDVDGDVFDRVSAPVRVSAHPGKILSWYFCNFKKSAMFLLIDVCLFLLQRHRKVVFSASAEIQCK